MIPTSDHNEVLADDELTSISLNYEWRQIIAPMLISGFGKWSASIDDPTERQAFDLRCLALYEDFYNLESPPVLSEPRYINLHRLTDQTITGGVPDTIDWNDVNGASSPIMWTDTFPDRVHVPEFEDGFYLITGTVFFPSSAATHVRTVNITIDGIVVFSASINILTLYSLTFAHGQFINTEAFIRLQIVSPTTISVQGDANGITQMSVVRIPFIE